jgi:hypothetical protein
MYHPIQFQPQIRKSLNDSFIAVSGRVRDTSTQEAIEINRLE